MEVKYIKSQGKNISPENFKMHKIQNCTATETRESNLKVLAYGK